MHFGNPFENSLDLSGLVRTKQIENVILLFAEQFRLEYVEQIHGLSILLDPVENLGQL